jgi:RimJ/RimL family protein N-acetyltransferase
MYAKTERLLIRDFLPDDWLAVHAFLSDLEVTKHTSFYKRTQDDTKRFVDDCIFHNNQVPRFAHNSAIVLSSENALIGWIGFGHPAEDGIADRSFGYALHRGHWNRGYMTEALRAMLRFCFADPEVSSVFAEHRVPNPASGRVMEKAGMTYAGMFGSRAEPGIIERRFIVHRDEWLAAHP